MSNISLCSIAGSVYGSISGLYIVTASFSIISGISLQCYVCILLNVADGPSFQSDGPTQTPTQRYTILGDHSLLILCGRGLDSNPQATIIWTAPDGTAVMDSTRYDLENGLDIVRLNLSRTVLSDNGLWVCEVVVRSEKHVVTNEGELILGGLAVIRTPLRHQLKGSEPEWPNLQMLS